jgi:predicted nucleic acid-binding protein
MTPCFADTFFFLALVSRKDPVTRARAADARRAGRPLVTTAWVLVETADALCDPPYREVFLRLYDALLTMRDVRIIEPSQSTLEQAISLYRNRPDKHWSLTDCISFVVMKAENITEALTADHHFEQAGFVALLKPLP